MKVVSGFFTFVSEGQGFVSFSDVLEGLPVTTVVFPYIQQIFYLFLKKFGGRGNPVGAAKKAFEGSDDAVRVLA